MKDKDIQAIGPSNAIKWHLSNTIKETIRVCVRSVRSFFVRSSFVRHTSLQNNVNGGVEPWSLVTKGRTLKENPE